MSQLANHLVDETKIITTCLYPPPPPPLSSSSLEPIDEFHDCSSQLVGCICEKAPFYIALCVGSSATVYAAPTATFILYHGRRSSSLLSSIQFIVWVLLLILIIINNSRKQSLLYFAPSFFMMVVCDHNLRISSDFRISQ